MQRPLPRVPKTQGRRYRLPNLPQPRTRDTKSTYCWNYSVRREPDPIQLAYPLFLFWSFVKIVYLSQDLPLDGTPPS